MRLIRAAAAAIIACAAPAAASAQGLAKLFVPSVKVFDERFLEFGSNTGVDNSAFNAFLETYTALDADGVRRVDYGAVTDADSAALSAYVDALEAVKVTDLSRDEALAHWMNLYNAGTIEVLLDNYPVDSIRDIRPNLFSIGPWDIKLFTVEGVEMSLNDIEHGVVRPVFQDQRVHYGLNCAAFSCPNLGGEAFEGDQVFEQLNANAKAYVNSARGATVDDRGRVTASKIYQWFISDFGGDEAGVLTELRQWAEPELKAQLDAVDDIKDFDYDWTLNDAAKAGS
ncbi:MAG: DUF547 domain-containing protein [Maricaulaceae bacterium]